MTHNKSGCAMTDSLTITWTPPSFPNHHVQLLPPQASGCNFQSSSMTVPSMTNTAAGKHRVVSSTSVWQWRPLLTHSYRTSSPTSNIPRKTSGWISLLTFASRSTRSGSLQAHSPITSPAPCLTLLSRHPPTAGFRACAMVSRDVSARGRHRVGSSYTPS
jgi:hypothetical protein